MDPHKSNYCSCSTPTNNRSKWVAILLIIVLGVAFSYPYIFDYLMRPEKPAMVSNGKRGIVIEKKYYSPGKYRFSKTEQVLAFQHYYRLYKVPQCLMDYEISMRKDLGHYDRLNRDQTIMQWPSAPTKSDFVTVQQLTDSDCEVKIEFIGTLRVTFQKEETKEKAREKVFELSKKSGANWAHIADRSLIRIPKPEAGHVAVTQTILKK